MVSGLVIVSEGERLRYPYIESIKSFQPVTDEIVVIYNRYKDDGTKDRLKKLGVRLVPSVFDIDRYGWTAYAIARTLGYQACKGDYVLMFDCDGVLHERHQDILKERLENMSEQHPIYYWGKHRFYTANRYWVQHKHSGIYYKKVLGDSFHFWADNQKGVPYTKDIPFEFRAKQIDVELFGYEHIWETKDVLVEKISRYSKMLGENKSPKQAYADYVTNLRARLNERGKNMEIPHHPKIMHDRLNLITGDMFGYNLGKNWDAG